MPPTRPAVSNLTVCGDLEVDRQWPKAMDLRLWPRRSEIAPKLLDSSQKSEVFFIKLVLICDEFIHYHANLES